MADWDRVESFFRQGGVDFEVRGYDALGCTQREGFRDFQVGGVCYHRIESRVLFTEDRNLNRIAARTESFCNDHFDCSDPRYRLPVSDRGRVAAEREKRRLGRGFRRTGQPDSVWSAGRGFGSFPGDDLVRDHFHGYVDHAFDFCRAQNWAHVCAFRSKASADEVAARDTGSAFCAASRSEEPGADTEIIC
jgi:hypothetical protein